MIISTAILRRKIPTFRTKNRNGRLTVVLAAATFAVSAAAEQFEASALKRLSLEELARIEVVSSSKSPIELKRVPMAMFVITNDDIRRSGATTIPEALRLAPGVDVARIEGSKWSVGIRGFGSRLSRSVLVLIDGRTVYTTFFAGTYWEVQDTLLEDVDRIEVIRGPGGTIWGPNAVNGVINIITRSAKETQGTLVSAGGGNEEQRFVNFRYGGNNGGRLSYRVYGKAFTRGPHYHWDGRNFDDWRAAQTGFRLDWEQSQRDTVTLTGDAYTMEAGQAVETVTYEPPHRRLVQGNAPLSGGNLNARWVRALGDGSDIRVQAFYDRTNRLEANFGENRDTGDVDVIIRSRIKTRHQLTWGAGARVSDGRATEVVSGLTFDPLRRTDYLVTGFFQDEIEVAPEKLWLTGGTKILRTNFTGALFEPSVRALWAPSREHAIWGSFTRVLRTPSRAERDFFLSGYVGTTPEGLPFMARLNANRGFESEKLNGSELGYRTLIRPNLYLSIATFYNRYDDLFSQEITGAPFLETTPQPPHLLLPARFANSLFGSTSGYELSPEWRPGENWRLRAQYSYLNMRIETDPGAPEVGTARLVERSSPRHQVLVQSSVDITDRFQLDMFYRYMAARPGHRVPSYSTGDARLAWRLGRNLELAFVGRNLLQPHHPEFPGESGLLGVRRSAYMKLTWTQ